MSKSANKIWRESGSALKFNDWLKEWNKTNLTESTLHSALPFDGNGISETFNTRAADASLNIPDPILSVTNETLAAVLPATAAATPATTTSDSNNVLGLNKTVLIASAVLITGAVVYYFYMKRRA